MPLIQWILNLGSCTCNPCNPVYITSGGIIMGGSAGVAIDLVVPIDITWDIQASMEISTDFEWNIGAGTLYYYSVETGCTHVTCATTGIDPNDPKCNPNGQQQSIQIIAGTSVADVCTQLQEKYLKSPVLWPVKTIKKYSRPVKKTDIQRDEAKGIDHSCNTLQDVPWKDVPACIPFTLTDIAQVDMRMNVYVQTSFLSAQGTGGIHMSGSAVVIEFGIPTPTGGIHMGGSADVSWNCMCNGYDASGGIVTGGSADVTSPVWNYITPTPPGIQMGGAAIVATQSYFYIADTSVGIVTSGVADAALIGIAATGTGGIVTGGAADANIGHLYYGYVPDGGIHMDSASTFVSPAWSWVGTGGIETGGSYTNRLVYRPDGNGPIQTGGSAVVAHGFAYIGVGGIVTSGGALVTDSSAWSVNPSGGIVTGGGALYTSSWIGNLNVNMGMTPALVSLASTPPVAPASSGTPLVANAFTVQPTGCDCRSFPGILYLIQNITERSSILSSFLSRNNYTLPQKIALRYYTKDSAWRNSFNFVGTGDNGSNERWTLIFEWSCIKQFAGQDLDESMWKLAITVQRRNLDVNYMSDTRILYTMGVDPNCLPSQFDLTFKVNSLTGAITLPPRMRLDQEAFKDEIGVFKSPDWRNTPQLSLRVTEVSNSAPENTHDISPLFAPVTRKSASLFR